MIKHIVLLKPKTPVEAEVLETINQKLSGLTEFIPEIIDYSWSANIGNEKRDRGFGYGFMMTFQDLDALERYLVHPEHKKVGAYIVASVAEFIVFDLPVK